MKTRALFAAVLAAVCAAGPAFAQNDKVAERPFVPGGTIELWLDAGDFIVKPASGDRIRVELPGKASRIELTASGNRGKVVLRNTPHTDFQAIIEVPKRSDLMIRMYAGDLNVIGITGDKDVESTAGDVRIDAGQASDYASVDASVKVGDLSGGPFGGAKGEFISKRLAWTGSGKFKLRASLSYGDLKLQ